MRQDAPKTRQDASKTRPRRAKTLPRHAQGAPKTRQNAPKTRLEAASRSKMLPRRVYERFFVDLLMPKGYHGELPKRTALPVPYQDRFMLGWFYEPRRAQDSVETRQELPKTRQDAPRRAQDARRRAKTLPRRVYDRFFIDF